jgi:hypothetical protein
MASELQQEQSAAAAYQAGASDALDVLSARLESANAALTALDGEERLQSALGVLEDALQQPADSLASVIQKMSSKM